MDNQDFVSYPLAKLLKECGFDEPCECYYTNGYANDSLDDLSRVVKFHRDRLYNHNMVVSAEGACYSAPTLWQTQKWLREKHHISIRISYVMDAKKWFYDWLNLEDGSYDCSDDDSETYEQALQEGIKAALELIKHENE